jgi:hypothetical protein
MEGYVQNQWVLIAQDTATGQPLGYCAWRDRYLKRDELGVIYQLCVEPGAQRGYVGAALIQQVFQRSAYGCRLYCCWCAQDLGANSFWESLGFVPIAFRGGSDRKKRVHIFWQKRIVDGDTSTRYWYPSATNGGAIRADRLVFPIPPGVHWKDVQAVVVPVEAIASDCGAGPAALPAPAKARAHREKRAVAADAPSRARFRGLYFGRPNVSLDSPAKPTAPKARAQIKIHPKFISAARELRDRWLEKVNEMPALPGGKYDVSRALQHVQSLPMLEAA